MEKLHFLHPHFFWLLLFIPVAVFWHVKTFKKQKVVLKMSSVQVFKNNATWRSKAQPFLFVLRILALTAIIIALARPRTFSLSDKIVTTNGIDIVMAIDVSGSMLAQDLKPNRLQALKRVASKFITDRKSDRIGLVLYAGESYTKTPVTSDKVILQQAIESISFDNSVIADGTAIGMGLATAINRIKDSKTKTRIIILMTDGVNNAGTIDPRMAATIAKEYGIKVYTIGIGTNGQALFPYAIDNYGKIQYRKMDVEIDEALLKEIALETKAKYFRATDTKKLEQIYNEINALEKSKVNETKYFNYDEKYVLFTWIAFVFLGVEVFLRNTIFKGFI